MSLPNWSRVILGAAAAAVTFAVTGPAPAGADPGGTCASTAFCLYENKNYNSGNTDHWRNLYTSDKDFRDNVWIDGNRKVTDDGMDNETSSVRNNTNCVVTIYQHPGYSGAATTFIRKGQKLPSLSNYGIGDNRASSAKFTC
ncbi:peptidase inhibitor family I36 protein [Nonomuraea sp. B5E05]|uniref:peptidase inhibitor family I36 protein n=1 Tax=Nonomuraea sp. B5E05 TaxID=3153569 RepID=UPI00326166D8